MLYSYDIFDTIITRRTAQPKGIFALVQEKLKREAMQGIPREVADNFYELRVGAERLARRRCCRNGEEEVTIPQIYGAFNLSRLLSQEQIDCLIALEKQTELDNVLPIDWAVDEVLGHIEKGERVILISDMYWDEETLRLLLQKACPKLATLPVYVSSAVKKTKSSGNLFRHVQKSEGISYNQWVHTGDNLESDNKVPMRLGIAVKLVNQNRMTDMERAVLEGMEDRADFQLFVGVSKNTGLLFPGAKEKKVGATLGGCLLGAYTKWILKDAVERGVQSLYFVARDGFILKQMADIYIQEMGLPILTHYLYGSRKAWRLPAMSEETDLEFFINASVPSYLVDLESLGKVFDLTLEDLQAFLPGRCKSGNQALSLIDVQILGEYLARRDDFRQFVIAKNSKKKKLAQQYLLQEIDSSETNIAFVELGGTGYTQQCLETLLKGIYNGQTATYFFELYGDSSAQEFRVFFIDSLHIMDAIEPLCRAPHGQTVGYKKAGGKVEPELEEGEEQYFAECGYDEYIQGVLEYARVSMRYYKDIFWEPVNRRAVKKCWDYYTYTEDAEILDFVGAVPFSAAAGSSQVTTYAPRLSKKEIEKIFSSAAGMPQISCYRGASLDVSMLRMSREEREWMECCKRAAGQDAEESERQMAALVKIPLRLWDSQTKFAIYGAGNMGKALYYNLITESPQQLAFWVDKNYEFYQREGYDVSAPQCLAGGGYDIVIIAALRQAVADSISEELERLCVPKQKVAWLSPGELLEG